MRPPSLPPTTSSITPRPMPRPSNIPQAPRQQLSRAGSSSTGCRLVGRPPSINRSQGSQRRPGVPPPLQATGALFGVQTYSWEHGRVATHTVSSMNQLSSVQLVPSPSASISHQTTRRAVSEELGSRSALEKTTHRTPVELESSPEPSPPPSFVFTPKPQDYRHEDARIGNKQNSEHTGQGDSSDVGGLGEDYTTKAPVNKTHDRTVIDLYSNDNEGILQEMANTDHTISNDNLDRGDHGYEFVAEDNDDEASPPKAPQPRPCKARKRAPLQNITNNAMIMNLRKKTRAKPAAKAPANKRSARQSVTIKA
ncbi:hypothetical protein BGZ47_002589 [Haplosporangium gracile]|nr:hypothetical protein BGZ47_002589 [Haplosporangium gracile]